MRPSDNFFTIIGFIKLRRGRAWRKQGTALLALVFIFCFQAAGGVVNAARISFDRVPPIISQAQPSGKIYYADTAISCVTNEKSICRYDFADVDYSLMKKVMSSMDGGLKHIQNLNLPRVGDYAGYIRCRDEAGNTTAQSVKVEFSYELPKLPEGALKISESMPAGKIYQDDIVLTLATNVAADCRYSLLDADYSLMSDGFLTDDGLSHFATVELGDYGDYVYHVRCKNRNDNTGANVSAKIEFEYIEVGKEGTPQVALKHGVRVACIKYFNDDANGECFGRNDCVCDSDCVNGEDDVDCANAVAAEGGAQSNWLWAVAGILSLAALIFVVFVISEFKRMNQADMDMV